jgi:hypothetical protein
VQRERRSVDARVGEAGRDRRGRLRGSGPQRDRARGQRCGVDRAQRTQDARALGHRRREGAAARRRQRDHRQRAPEPEAEPGGDAQRRVPERHAHPRQRPDGEREDEGREPEAEQHAVEAGRERHGQHAAPRLRHLAAHLRHDPRPPRLPGGRRERDERRHRRRPGAERLTRQREPAERHDPAGERAEREGRARDDRRPQPPRVAGGRERLDHREPARGPRAGHAGGDRRDDQDGGQHLTRVS